MEQLAEEQLIDLYYGDEARVSTEPCIPYGWQFFGRRCFYAARKKAAESIVLLF
ncbi:MAG: hypothetical protein ACR2MG_17350 [Pyrinomonadaceae bacterium]